MTAKYNEKKTKELVEELKGKGHIRGMEDLSKFIQKTGVVVIETVGRRRSYIEVNPKVYGVDLNTKTDSTKQFFEDHVKQGKISFIPDALEKELGNAESAVRTARRRAAIGFDDRFMPIDIYKQFLPTFEKHKGRYFETRDKIIADWGNLMTNFERNLRQSLADLNAVDQEIVIAQLLSKIPTKEAYRDSFYLDLSVKPFPVMESLEIFDAELQETIADGMQDDAIDTMYEIIATCLADGFQQLGQVLSTIEKGHTVGQKSTDALQAAAKRMRQRNIIANDRVNDISTRVDNVSRMPDFEEQAEAAEQLAADILGYATELHLEDRMPIKASPYTYDELMNLYEMDHDLSA